MAPLIALVTDFGLRDAYVGAMKGAILTICPAAAVVDVVHELPAHDVIAGALALEAVFGHFPADTVFVAVVDPGVGSNRRAIACAAAGRSFVAPDNGLVSFVLDADPLARVHEITHPALRRAPMSAVFQGRDLFGPVAAHLARGVRLEDVGPEVRDPVRLTPPVLEPGPGGLRAEVIHVDRFGNLTTNVREADLVRLFGTDPGATEVRLGPLRLPFVRTYSDVGVGEPCALVGSGGRLEIAVREGRADSLVGWRDSGVSVSGVVRD